jgi:NAD(P)-dependent dehydrogenase (short-subunit alcohol dehydrogenase family)
VARLTSTNSLAGKVAIVTGAGRGLGRSHALLLALEGARVVVNDVGAAKAGGGRSVRPAQRVVREIEAAGGVAVANFESVSDWSGARRLIEHAVETFGRLDVLVNNAGIIIRKRTVDMTEAEFDSLIEVHLKGTLATSIFAARHWRERVQAGEEVDGRLINTTSEAATNAIPLRAAYGAAKAGVITLTWAMARECAGYGVRVNAIAPRARTRMNSNLASSRQPSGLTGFDASNPANVSPIVVWLASSAAANVTGRVFHVWGSTIRLFGGFEVIGSVDAGGKRWTTEGLAEAYDELCRQDRLGAPAARRPSMGIRRDHRSRGGRPT